MSADLEFERLISTRALEIDRRLKAYFQGVSMDDSLKRVVEYALFPGGKRIRPMVALLICEDLGGGTAELLAAAPALEIVHCASLIHDDLPALDNDDMRRGRAACHRRFDEASAILAGDAMPLMAVEMLLRRCSRRRPGRCADQAS